MQIKFQDIKEIIDKNDPIGLLSMGAPSSEFGIETSLIFDNLKNNMNRNEIEELVINVFTKQFDKDIIKNSIPKLVQISKEIHELMENEQ
jgi:hypothetical protein